MKKLLWIGDATVATGFAKCTHETLRAFTGPDWEVHVLGLNYKGDPHRFPYDIYPCWPGGDLFGLGRTAELVSKVRPDVVVVQNDPWNIPQYAARVGNVPLVASMPVDGKNCRGKALNGIALGLFWTEFGRREAQRGGFGGDSAVVPLGVDLAVFKAYERTESRRMCGLPYELRDSFIIGNVNRNQPRKRLDLTVQYFAEWVRSSNVDDAFLYLHVAPTNDQGYDCLQLMEYYGLAHKLILAEPPVGPGIPEEKVARTFSCFDVQVTTTQGEGWGLTTMEGMACGVPQIVPQWAALGEWATAALQVPCHEQAVTPNNVNAIGGLPDKHSFIEALDQLHRSREARTALSVNGQRLVSADQYRWPDIAERFRDVVEQALSPVLVGWRAAAGASAAAEEAVG